MEIPANETSANANVNGSVKGKPFNPMTLLKMAGLLTKKGEDGEDAQVDASNIIPFLQLLNQQMSKLFQGEKIKGVIEGATAGEKGEMFINGKFISPEQYALLLLQKGKLLELQPGNDELIKPETGKNMDIAFSKNDIGGEKILSLLQSLSTKENVISKEEILSILQNLSATENAGNDELSELAELLSAKIKEMENIHTANNLKRDVAKEVAINFKTENISKSDMRSVSQGVPQQQPEVLPDKYIYEGLRESKQEKIDLAFRAKTSDSTEENIKESKSSNEQISSKNEESRTKIFNDDFKNRLRAFINAPNDDKTSEENAFIKDKLNFTLVESAKSAIAKDEQKNPVSHNKTLKPAEAMNAAKIEVIQSLFNDINEKVKTDNKAKTHFSEKPGENMTSGSLSASGPAAGKAENSIAATDIISRVAAEIKESAATDGGRIKITLNPPSLGRLEMDVIVRNGKVEVVLVANNKDVQNTLNSNIEQLKGSLQNQGLTIERCDVFMQDKNEEFNRFLGNHAHNQKGSERQGRGEKQEKEEKELFAAIPVTSQNSRVSGITTDAISLFA